MLKWGNTEVTAVKWGNTNVAVVKWGNTVVFPAYGTGYDGNNFSTPLAGGMTSEIRSADGVVTSTKTITSGSLTHSGTAYVTRTDDAYIRFISISNTSLKSYNYITMTYTTSEISEWGRFTDAKLRYLPDSGREITIYLDSGISKSLSEITRDPDSAWSWRIEFVYESYQGHIIGNIPVSATITSIFYLIKLYILF